MRRPLLAFFLGAALIGCAGVGVQSGDGTTGGTVGTLRVLVHYPNVDLASPDFQNQPGSTSTWIRSIGWTRTGSSASYSQMSATTQGEHTREFNLPFAEGTYTFQFWAYANAPTVWPNPPNPLLGFEERSIDIVAGQTVTLAIAPELSQPATVLTIVNQPLTATVGAPKVLTAHLRDTNGATLVTVGANKPGFRWDVLSGDGSITIGGTFTGNSPGVVRVRVRDFKNEFSAEADITVN